MNLYKYQFVNNKGFWLFDFTRTRVAIAIPTNRAQCGAQKGAERASVGTPVERISGGAEQSGLQSPGKGEQLE